MNVGDEKTQSLWMDTDVAPDAVALTATSAPTLS
jgi:hypothetical protein